MKSSVFRYTAAILAAVVFISIWRLISPDTDSTAPLLQRFTTTTLIYALLVFPISEEIIFRGLIQQSLQRRINTPLLSQNLVSPANLISSTLFAMAHALYFTNPVALLVFFPSLVFGYMYEKERTLFAPIAIHASYNLIGLFGLALF